MNAYDFTPHDNDTFAFSVAPKLTRNQKLHQSILPEFGDEDRPGLERCPACKEMLNKWEVPLDGLRIRKRRLEVGATYDGLTVVNERFKGVYEENQLTGLDFRQLAADPGFYAIRPLRSVAFDAERSQTRFEYLCNVCGKYESIILVAPVMLKAEERISPREFVRSDVEFASNDEKSPLILCGEQAGAVLKAMRFKGLELLLYTVNDG